MRVSTPFADRVPRTVIENLQWRAKVHEYVAGDFSRAQGFVDACYHDPIFYVNGFVWTYDPRNPPFTKVPMVLYPFQERDLLEIISCIGSKDLMIKKSRDMGASWLCLIAFEWLWHFRVGLSFLMGSRTENYVDNADNPKSLFWKIDYLHDGLPEWLMPAGFNREVHRRKMHLTNPQTGSVIDGESTNAEFARGDRRTAILLDEFAAVKDGATVLAATSNATKSRIFNSTPLGTNNAYYDLELTNISKLTMHWTEHPVKRVGMYTTDTDGNLKVIDVDGYPKDYKPILDGRLRSIEFDVEWGRQSERIMAQEWEIDFGASHHNFFRAKDIRSAIRLSARPPMFVGELDFDTTTCEPTEFREDESGSLKLWFSLQDGKPKFDHKVVVGVDISAGTGSSNSAICGWDTVTNEKLFEYVNPFVRPEELAKKAVALCRWSGPGTYMIWEANGPGRQFGAKVIELRYAPVYFRRREEAVSKKVTEVPGWHSTDDSKQMLLGKYRTAIENGTAANRSKAALEECLDYVYDQSGRVAHSREKSKTDPTGARSNHGDRVIADALAWYMISERKSRKLVTSSKPAVPIGSLAWRIAERDRAKRDSGLETTSAKGW